VETPADIERVVASLGATPNSGLIVLPDASTLLHRDLIIGQAARHRVPTVYGFRVFVDAGGLASYDSDITDHYRQAASYVDRILRGTVPSELPAQTPTRYETIINLKTARALGLTVPATLLARADQVIE
jgi:putative ABC transport system substrate-binding protein